MCDCVFVCVHVCVCVCACVWGECVVCSSNTATNHNRSVNNFNPLTTFPYKHYSACMGTWLVDLNYLLICSLVRHMFKKVRMKISDKGGLFPPGPLFCMNKTLETLLKRSECNLILPMFVSGASAIVLYLLRQIIYLFHPCYVMTLKQRSHSDEAMSREKKTA